MRAARARFVVSGLLLRRETGGSKGRWHGAVARGGGTGRWQRGTGCCNSLRGSPAHLAGRVDDGVEHGEQHRTAALQPAGRLPARGRAAPKVARLGQQANRDVAQQPRDGDDGEEVLRMRGERGVLNEREGDGGESEAL